MNVINSEGWAERRQRLEGRLHSVREELWGDLAQSLEHSPKDDQSLTKLLDQFIGLVDRVTELPEYHPRILRVLKQLETFPTWFNHANVLERHLYFAYVHGDNDSQAQFRMMLARLYLEVGQFDKAVKDALGSIFMARQSKQAWPFVQAIGVLVTRLLYRGEPQAALKLLQSYQEELQNWSDGDSFACAAGRVQWALLETEALRAKGTNLKVLVDVLYLHRETVDSLPVDYDALKAEYWDNLGLLEWARGHSNLAIYAFKQARLIYRSQLDNLSLCRIRAHLALVYWSRGELQRAEALNRRCLREWCRDNNPRSVAATLCNLGLVYVAQGKLDTASQCYHQALKIAERYGMERESDRARSNQAALLFHAGDYDQAHQYLETQWALRKDAKTHNQNDLTTLVDLARSYHLQGRTDEAQHHAAYVLQKAREQQLRPLEVIALRVLAECSPAVEAQAYLIQALPLAQGKRRLDEAAIYLHLAYLSADPEAQKHLEIQGLARLYQMQALGWVERYRSDELLRLPLFTP